MTKNGFDFLAFSRKPTTLSDSIDDEWISQDQASIRGQVCLVGKPLNSGLTPGLEK